MSIEDDVKNRIAQIATQQNKQSQINHDIAIEKAQYLFDGIHRTIINTIIKTGKHSATGQIRQYLSYSGDSDTIEEQVIAYLFSKRKTTTQKRGFLWNKWVYDVTISRDPQADWDAFFDKFNKLITEKQIRVSWYIAENSNPKTRVPIDPNTFQQFHKTYIYASDGSFSSEPSHVLLEYSYP